MSFAKRASEGPSTHRQYPPCALTKLLWSLSDKEAAGLRTMLDSGDWTHAQISKALFDEGHPIGRDTVGRHRGGECCKSHR